MIRFAVIALLLVTFAMQTWAQARERDEWDGTSLPITIEVTRDVPVKSSERRSDGSYGQERGALYSSKSFIITKGRRFRVIELMREGTCRIEFEGSQYELSACPWMPGFRDRQADIFRIVEFRNRER